VLGDTIDSITYYFFGSCLLRTREENMTNEHPDQSTESYGAHSLPKGVHLVGSIPLSSADEVFRTTSSILGERLRRIPDGETGIRSGWIGWQFQLFASNPSFDMVEPPPNAYVPRSRFNLRSPRAPGVITFEQLGYAGAALDSYRLFSQLKQEGVIPAKYRFQICLPTPLAPVSAFVVQEDQAEVEPVYEAAMLTELDRITSNIPQDELAIQWDTAIEFAILEGAMPIFMADSKAEILERLIRLGNRVPVPVEMGFHLCYGDAGHKHFKEPEDTGKLVEVANALSVSSTRPINWIHMPVPRDRSDAAYYAPLRNLRLHPETELYLGLVHYTDGAEGTLKRIKAAQQFVAGFGVATECGFGRRPPDTIPELLRIHSQVAEPVSG
jgi:hypothetical protein